MKNTNRSRRKTASQKAAQRTTPQPGDTSKSGDQSEAQDTTAAVTPPPEDQTSEIKADAPEVAPETKASEAQTPTDQAPEDQVSEDQVSEDQTDKDQATEVDSTNSPQDTVKAEAPLDEAPNVEARAAPDVRVDAEADDKADTDADGTPDADPAPKGESSQPAAEPEHAPQTSADTPPAPAQTVVTEKVIQRKGGFLPMVLGGIVAAGLGYGAAQYPDGWPFAAPQEDPFRNNVAGSLSQQADQIAALEATLATTQDRAAALDTTLATGMETLGAQISGMEDRQATATGQLDGRIDAMTGQITAAAAQADALATQVAALSLKIDASDAQTATLSDRMAELQTRLAALEKRPIEETVSPEAIAAYEREIDRLREEVTAQRNDVAQMAQQAVAAEQSATILADTARARAALAEVFSALDNGTAFDGLLPRLASTGVVVPAGLTSVAADGIPTQGELVAAFPEAARDAVAADRTAAADAGDAGGLSGLLQRQLGLRSLTPQAGDSADAVLSRAEAALRGSDLAGALAEIDALSGPAAATLAPVRALIETRRAALEAAASVADALN